MIQFSGLALEPSPAREDLKEATRELLLNLLFGHCPLILIGCVFKTMHAGL